MKKKIILICSVFVILAVVFICLQWNVIFQRGNPFPYLIAITKLSEENSFVKVNVNKEIYITKKGDSSKLFDFFEESNNVEFVEQAGSCYIFSNGIDNLIISSEIYWSKYTVWTLPVIKI